MLTFVKIIFVVSIVFVVTLIVELLFNSESVELVIVSNILLELAFVIAIEIVFEFFNVFFHFVTQRFAEVRRVTQNTKNNFVNLCVSLCVFA